MVVFWNHQNLLKTIYLPQFRGVKISSCFNDHVNVESGVPQGSISGSLVFNIFILFFDDIEIDLANYADDTDPADYDHENEKIVILLEKNIDKAFPLVLRYNFLKANPENYYLLINMGENITLKIKNETITESSNQKLLGILYYTTRVWHYMILIQRKVIMNSSIFFLFLYCPLECMLVVGN